MFQGESRLATLPPYLTVQMVRFFYKADVQQKAKILRKVGGCCAGAWAEVGTGFCCCCCCWRSSKREGAGRAAPLPNRFCALRFLGLLSALGSSGALTAPPPCLSLPRQRGSLQLQACILYAPSKTAR